MSRHTVVIYLFGLAVLAIIAGHGVRAAALIGPNRNVEVPAAAAPAFDQVREKYSRPAAIPFPFDNAYTPQKALLGRMLFHEPRLSGSGTLSCASCHNPGFAYGDGLPKAIGDGMRTLARRTPTVVNGAWGEAFMWDGRAV
jgi:cytochrome c peroxidase